MTEKIDFQKIEKNSLIKNRALSISVYAMLAIWALVVIFPFYWMILTSVKEYASYNAEVIPQFFPTSPTLENYVKAFTEVPLARYILNTIIFTVITTAIMIEVIVPASFAFAKLDFKGNMRLHQAIKFWMHRSI